MSHRRFLLLLLLLPLQQACVTAPRQITHYQASYTAIDTSLRKDSRMEAMLQTYRSGVDTLMNAVIGHTSVPLSKAQPECTLGNFMADAQLAAARRTDPSVAASVLNYGGLRLPYIGPGPVTKGKLYELMPFDNKLTLLDIPGTILRTFCDHIAAYGGWPVAGMHFIIKDKKAADIYIGNEPLDDMKTYKVAVPDYVADGGDHCSFLTACKRSTVDIFIRDLLIDYVAQLHRQGLSLSPSLEKRISYAQ